jgi:hypothetical protein
MTGIMMYPLTLALSHPETSSGQAAGEREEG